MEIVEDELRDTVSTVRQERDDLMEQLTDVQSSLSSQEAQIKLENHFGAFILQKFLLLFF